MAGARSLWRANGMRETQFGRPIIGIANSFTQFVPGTSTCTRSASMSNAASRPSAASPPNSTPSPWTTASPWATGHALLASFARIIADSIEYMANAHCIDALVLIGNCDKVTPAC